MTGIEPAFYGGFMALCALVAMVWKGYAWLKNHVAEETKPIREKLDGMSSRMAVHEAQVKLAESQFHEFRLEVARTYTTKEDVTNAIRPVLDSVERLTNSVDNMNTRIDRVIEQSNAAKTTTRRATTK